ncbi:hypothetical protein QUW36_01925 [Clostridium cadaveris]|uniref:hypothetical protein n=1 Tax=Clostridium cadaveris TaxID=1529 RepID=UPI0025A43C5B|nr:hypothetical protein [Clostridium cadaveris]MDM8310807.1 hypothetical protein [Clostridium cadaveris]
MKFYEFNKHEYYALILALNEEEALKAYEEEIVGEIEEDEIELTPDIITEKQALKRYKKALIENCETEEEKEEDFYIFINSFKYRQEEAIKLGIELSEKYQIFLVDGRFL